MNLQLNPFSSKHVAEVKQKALRRRVWYNATTKIERACLDLVIKLVEQVQSRLLTRTVSSIVKKLEEAMESKVYRLMRNLGPGLAKETCIIARKWGNKSAEKWPEDHGFIQFLTITFLNKQSNQQ